MDFLLWLVAVCLVVYGIYRAVTGSVLLGIALIILGCLIGPGGYSIFHAHHRALGPPAGAQPFASTPAGALASTAVTG